MTNKEIKTELKKIFNYIEYLESHNKNYNKTQYNYIYESLYYLNNLIKQLEEEEDESHE